MANIKSSIKRIQITKVRTARNRAYKSRIKTAERRVHEALASGNREEVAERLRHFTKTIDTASQKGIVHRNTAARRKSRLTRYVQQALAQDN